MLFEVDRISKSFTSFPYRTVQVLSDVSLSVADLTSARRTQARVLNRWLTNRALVSGVVHDQQITIGMKLDGGLHRLTVQVHHTLDAEAQARMARVAERGAAAGFGGL